jgi:hypothetical protein
VFAIAAACEIAALFTSGFDTAHAHWARVEADTGHGYGYWISLVSVIVGAGLALAGAAQVRDRPDAFGRSARLGGPRGEG